jgi:hypothetical protein
MIHPRLPTHRLAAMNGHNIQPTTRPMPRPIAWKTRVKKFTIGSSMLVRPFALSFQSVSP